MSTLDSRTADPLIGQEIGEYHLTRVLGRGGMGVVYAAEDTALGITVALKMIDPALARDAAFVRRFRAEARAMARLASPHVVRVMAMRQTEHGLFIVMEYVDGGTVYDRMSEGPMPWPEVAPLARQVLLALEQAHAVGVVHRDIKPRNTMLTADGTVKVTDFGLAKVASDDPTATVTQAVSGTLLYMSPEQVRASPVIDGRSDLFALGLMLYEMLAGRLPFDRDAGEFAVMRAIVEEAFPPPTKFRPDIPAPVARAVMKALEKNPDRRYPSAAAMREALEDIDFLLRSTKGTAKRSIAREARTPNEAPTRRARPALWPFGGAGGYPRWALWGGLAGLGTLVAAALILWLVLPERSGAAAEPSSRPTAEARGPAPDRPTDGPPPESGSALLGAPEEEPAETPDEPAPSGSSSEATEPSNSPPPPPPEPGRLAVEARPGVRYTVGGRAVEGSRELPAGTHTVRCEAGGASAQTTVRVRSGEASAVACYAEQAVNVSAAFEGGPSSWVSVWVDGRSAGQTPTRFTLGPGRHTVSVSRAGYEILTGEQVVEVRPAFEPLPARRLSFQVRSLQ